MDNAMDDAVTTNNVVAADELVSPFRGILVLVDGSDSCLDACRKAIRLASTYASPITALYVVDDKAVNELTAASGQSQDAVRRQMEGRARRYLDHVAQIADRCGVTCQSIVRRGIPHSQVADVASELGVDLIVMGESRPRNARRAVSGVLTERIIEYAECSVLVVRSS